MPVHYDVKAAIVNESQTHIERLVAKIIRLSGKANDEFLKTFPLEGNSKNNRTFAILKEDIYSSTRINYLGIGFVSYGVANYIKFASCFKSFSLEQGDKIEFYFEDDTCYSFEFTSPKQNIGFLNRNTHIITDQQLEYISKNNLKYWKLYSAKADLSIVGGFVHVEQNNQYKSEKVGQKILKLMAENILTAKEYI